MLTDYVQLAFTLGPCWPPGGRSPPRRAAHAQLAAKGQAPAPILYDVTYPIIAYHIT